MNGTRIEVEHFITRRSVEAAYAECKRAQLHRRESFAQTGMRAARARHPGVLLALQKGSEILQRMSEEQLGTHGLDVGGIHVNATEFSLWKEAYIAADKGEALPNLMWIYGAAALLAGLIR
jgi:hypothetical protein